MPGLETTFNGTVRDFVATIRRYEFEAWLTDPELSLYELVDSDDTSARVEFSDTSGAVQFTVNGVPRDWQPANAVLYATSAPGQKTLLTLYKVYEWQEWRYVESTYRPLIQRLVADGWIEPSALDYQRAVARLGWIEPSEEYSRQVEEPATSGNRLESLTLRDRHIVRLWCDGKTAAEILPGLDFAITAKTLANRISELRQRLGPDVVPYHRAKKGIPG